MRRVLVLLSVLCLFLGATACSDDEGDDKPSDDKSSPSARGVDPKEDRRKIARIENCDAEVRTTGAVAVDWSGEATVRTGGRNPGAPGPAAVYRFAREPDELSLYSPGREFTGSIAFFADGLSFSSDPSDAESFDIDKRGKRARVDATLTSISGKELQLVAEFNCGKQRAR